MIEWYLLLSKNTVYNCQLKYILAQHFQTLVLKFLHWLME